MQLEFSHEARQLPLGRYKHYKGGEYDVLFVGRSSDGDIPHEVVIYQDRSNPELIWVQSLARFLEEVDGKPRFAKV